MSGRLEARGRLQRAPDPPLPPSLRPLPQDGGRVGRPLRQRADQALGLRHGVVAGGLVALALEILRLGDGPAGGRDAGLVRARVAGGGRARRRPGRPRRALRLRAGDARRSPSRRPRSAAAARSSRCAPRTGSRGRARRAPRARRPRREGLSWDAPRGFFERGERSRRGRVPAASPARARGPAEAGPAAPAAALPAPPATLQPYSTGPLPE